LFSPSTPVSSTNKSDPHDITQILLKVAFNTLTPPPYSDIGLRALQYNLFVGFVLLDLKKTVGTSLFTTSNNVHSETGTGDPSGALEFTPGV
jgi:hypothetical protein